MSRIFPIIAIVFSIALFFLYIRPTYNGSISETKQKIGSYDAALAAAARFQQKEAELTQSRAQIPADKLAQLNEFLPDGVDNVQLILDLDALAARSGVTLSEFDTKSTDGSSNSSSAAPAASSDPSNLALAETAPVDSLDLTFKASGSYSSFRTFLAGMENSLRPIDVEDLDVAQSDTGIYTYSITTRIYWLR